MPFTVGGHTVVTVAGPTCNMFVARRSAVRCLRRL